MTTTRLQLKKHPITKTRKLALCQAEAAEALGLSENKLREVMANLDSGLPVVRVGRRVLFPVDELKAWLSDNVGRSV